MRYPVMAALMVACLPMSALAAHGATAPPSPSAHPAATNPEFLEALRDLRSAQAGIKGRTDKTPVSPHERSALNFIDGAVYTIQRDTDFKDSGTTQADVQVHPGEGRLHDVNAYLSKARSDLNSVSAKDRLKTFCVEVIDNAQMEVGRALKDYATPAKATR